MMPDALHDIVFHLLRPWWLLAIIPALLLVWCLYKKQSDNTGWASVIDSELLAALLDNSQKPVQKNWPMIALLLAWILASLGLAGPCFEKSDQTALKQADAVVILLDLSPSMLAKDVQPSRLQAAHYKILDLLRQRREGYTGLIAYAGSAHVVAPLSDDTNTIAALVTTLEPRIMPSIGSQTEDAVSEGLQLLENSHFSRGRLVLITDGVVPEALDNIQKQLRGKNVELHVIGVGTAAGAPISLQGGNFVKDENGKVIVSKLDEAPLEKLAGENGGNYSNLRTDDSDIAALIAPPVWLAQLGNGDQRDASHTVENWRDSGYWIVLPCLLIALLFFRRGVLVCLLPLLMLVHHEPVRAADLSWPETWQDWWRTPDQQALQALENGDAATAAKQFVDPQWKAYAEYQNGQHKEAAEHFAASESSNAHYNRGNALAKAGDLQSALDNYEEALKKQPDFEQATFNRDLVKKLLEQQKKQNQQNKQQDNQQKDDQQKDDQQKDDQQKDDQQKQGEKKSDDKQQPDQQQQDEQKNEDQQKEQQQSQSSDDQKKGDNEKMNEKQHASDEKSAEEEKKKAEEESQAKKYDKKSAQENGKEKKPEDKAEAESMSQADLEKQQATEQWLRKVPDDPGGLLKNKFQYYYQINRQQEARKQRAGIQDNEEQRW
jgi:Ca-activated chloride channel family protein